MAGNKTKATTNIKYGSGIPTSEAAGKPLEVARGKNRNYNDVIKKRDPVTGEVYYVEKWVDPVKT